MKQKRRMSTRKRAMCLVTLVLISSSLAQGCAASRDSRSLTTDSRSLNYPVYEPLANGKLVTIEVIHVNRSKTSGRSMEKAIEGFSKYVAGKVRPVQGKPIKLEEDSAGLLTLAQLAPMIANRRYSGPSDITIFVIPGLSDFPARGHLVPEANGSHTLVIQADRLIKRVPPLISREKWAHLVIKHELCHALAVPADRSHEWSDRHCTYPECILSPAPDARALLAAALRFGPPMDLCKVCQKEIQKAHIKAGGKLVPPNQPFNQAKWLNTIIELNPDNPKTLLIVAERYYDVMKNYKMVAQTLKKHLRLHPDDSRALGLYAWTLATCPDDSVRDGSLAVKLAESACSLTEWKNWRFVSTLAAAYAESGNFDSAIKFQDKAISMAGDKYAKSLRAVLELYKNKVPFHFKPQ